MQLVLVLLLLLLQRSDLTFRCFQHVHKLLPLPLLLLLLLLQHPCLLRTQGGKGQGTGAAGHARQHGACVVQLLVLRVWGLLRAVLPLAVQMGRPVRLVLLLEDVVRAWAVGDAPGLWWHVLQVLLVVLHGCEVLQVVLHGVEVLLLLLLLLLLYSAAGRRKGGGASRGVEGVEVGAEAALC